jgi:lysyl-tRNA synthetase class 2
MSVRDQGKACFAELQDSEGRIQLYLNRDVLCPEDDKTMYNQVFKKLTDLGDFIGIEDTTKVGAQCIRVDVFTFLSKTLPKVDEEGKVHDAFNDAELRYRMRM